MQELKNNGAFKSAIKRKKSLTVNMLPHRVQREVSSASGSCISSMCREGGGEKVEMFWSANLIGVLECLCLY